MRYCILIHYHELSLKKGNRKWFEDKFISNVHKHLAGLLFSKIKLLVGRIVVFDIEYTQQKIYLSRLKNVMGLMNATIMVELKADLSEMSKVAERLVEDVEYEA